MIRATRPGGMVCEPPFSQWPSFTQKTDGKWRKEFLSLALDHTAGLGLPTPNVADGATVVMSGHQPYLYHPGVLYKYALLARYARGGGVAVNLAVDTDLSGGYPLKVPSFDGKYLKNTRCIAPSAKKGFYCDVVLRKEETLAFAEEAVKDLASLPEKLFESGANFLRADFWENLPANSTDATTMIRRKYADGWDGPVLEVPLTKVCKTAGFFEFAHYLLANAQKFAEVFNKALHRYREEHKLRYPANPFPDLAPAKDGVETLFWIAKGEQRTTLVVKNSVCISEFGSEEIKTGADLRRLCDANGVRIWPKAVALSIINRLYLSDLFVHGLGGAKYDKITDEVISGFYGINPPTFAVASLTLDSGLEDPAQKILAEKQKLREMDFHPENFLKSPPSGLLEEKHKLTSEIQAPGANKKELGGKLGRVNAELKALLAPLKAEAEKTIASLEAEQGRYDVLADRELSFFLHPPDAFEPFLKT